jgi:HD-like signal output (HDOD) protein
MNEPKADRVTKLTQAQFLAAIARIEKFSPAPRILSRALGLLRDMQSDLGTIAALVQSDPALAADIIRCSNSAFYNTGYTVETVEQAVSKIGFRETVRLLNLAVAKIAAGRELRGYGISADDFWAESLFNGLFLQALAESTGKADADEAYTVGLLRFIGRLAINHCVEQLGEDFFWVGNESINQWEKDTVGFPQAKAGAILLSHWQFSEKMVHAIEHQDAPSAAAERIWLAEALYFASELVPQGLGAPFNLALSTPTPDVTARKAFMADNDLTDELVDRLIHNTREAFAEVGNAFGGVK